MHMEGAHQTCQPAKSCSSDGLALDKLTFIFAPSLAESLPQLQTLEIRHCRELEHIIRENDGEREVIPESLCFPKFKTLRIYDCGKLEYVSVSPCLPNLQRIKFPQLRELSLQLLRSKEFWCSIAFAKLNHWRPRRSG